MRVLLVALLVVALGAAVVGAAAGGSADADGQGIGIPGHGAWFEAACTGPVYLSFGSLLESEIRGMASGLSGCDGRFVEFRADSCEGKLVGNCAVTGPGCSATWPTPGAGEHTYAACIDLNGDADFADRGESAVSILKIVLPAPPAVVPPAAVPPAAVPGLLVWVGAGAVAILAIAGGLLWLWTRRKAKEQPKLTEESQG